MNNKVYKTKTIQWTIKYTRQKQCNGQQSTQHKNNTMDNKVHKTKTIQWILKYTKQKQYNGQ
jgi:hypothetical protein